MLLSGLPVSNITVVRDWQNMPSIAAQWYSKAMLPMTKATDAPYCNLASFHGRQFKHAKVSFDKPKQSCAVYCNKRPASRRQVKKHDGPPQNIDLPPQPAPIKKKKPIKKGTEIPMALLPEPFNELEEEPKTPPQEKSISHARNPRHASAPIPIYAFSEPTFIGEDVRLEANLAMTTPCQES
ncbi:hypothetical protein AKJ16_DCAP22032 [Drosera capensis]